MLFQSPLEIYVNSNWTFCRIESALKNCQRIIVIRRWPFLPELPRKLSCSDMSRQPHNTRTNLRRLAFGGQTVKNLRSLACKFELDQSERKSLQKSVVFLCTCVRVRLHWKLALNLRLRILLWVREATHRKFELNHRLLGTHQNYGLTNIVLICNLLYIFCSLHFPRNTANNIVKN